MKILEMRVMILLNGDCLEVMPKLVKNNSVNLVITSPPYNTSSKYGSTKDYKQRYDFYLDQVNNHEYINWTINIFNELDRVLMKNGCVLYNISYGNGNADLLWLTIAKIIEKTNFCVADCIIWKKKSAIPNNTSSNKLTRICEFVFVLCRKEEYKTFLCNKKIKSKSKTGQSYYHSAFNFVEARNNDEVCDLNKATYSSELVEQLIKIYSTSELDVILDPFMGTGTTGVACLELKRKFIGIELSSKQYEYAKERLQNIGVRKKKLF